MKKYFVAAAVLALSAIASSAHATIPDLRATLIAPTELAKGFDQRITFDVQNIGAARAGTVTETLTFSNKVTILESPYWCPVTTPGNSKRITCTTSKLNAGARITTSIRIRAPLANIPSTGTTFVYSAATVGDTITANNTVNFPMSFSSNFTPPVIQPPLDQAMMTTCSGSAPFDWSVCSASSNQVNQIELDSAQQVLYQGTPVGLWSKPSPSTLVIEFVDGNVVEAIYTLDTVSTSCYRGVGVFPNSTWFARMELCF